MKINRTWLASANSQRCNHRKAFNELGFVSWRGDRRRFAVGDVVFLYMKDTQRVEFKTIVTEIDVERKDTAFWHETPPATRCATLEMVACIAQDERLTWSALADFGFHPRSLEGPSCSNTKLLDHLQEIFD